MKGPLKLMNPAAGQRPNTQRFYRELTQARSPASNILVQPDEPCPPSYNWRNLTVKVCADCASGSTGGLGVLRWSEPLFMVNKANLANAAKRTRGHWPNTDWRKLREFEEALNLHAQLALMEMNTEPPWPLDAEYSVRIHLLFGTKWVRPKNRAAYPRKSRAHVNDVDAVKAILDAMQGVLWENDNQVWQADLRKGYRVAGAEGDAVLLDVYQIG